MLVEDIRKAILDSDREVMNAKQYLCLSPIIVKLKGFVDGEILGDGVQVVITRRIK